MPWTSGQADAKTFPEAWRDVVMKDREEHSTMPNHSRRYVQVWDGGILQAQDPNAEDSATGLRPVLHGVSRTSSFLELVLGVMLQEHLGRTG